MARPLVFFIDAPLSEAEELEEDFHYKPTQALYMLLEEIEAWVDQAQACFGIAPARCLDSHHEWLNAIQNFLESIYEALEDEEPDVMKCQLSADDDLYDALDTLLDSCPADDRIIEELRDKKVAQALVGLSGFWINHLTSLLKRLKSFMSNDGEVLAMLSRQKVLAALTF